MAFTVTVVPNQVGIADKSCSLALDAAGYPAIAYCDFQNNGGLNLIRYNGAVWANEVVDTEFRVGLGISATLMFDGSGYPHIIYLAQGNFPPPPDIRYNYKDGTGWHESVIATGPQVGNAVDQLHAVMDSNDKIHIAHYNQSVGKIVYLTNASGSWVALDASVGTVSCNEVSIDLDTMGNPHIAYNNATNATMNYAMYTGTDWIREVIDGPHSGQMGQFVSLVVRSDDTAAVAYYSSYEGQLMYAVRTGANTWTKEVIDDDIENRGRHCCLALDADNRPVIIYESVRAAQEGYILSYAAWDGEAWQKGTVDAGTEADLVGDWASVKVASDGAVHVGYVNQTEDDIYYATDDFNFDPPPPPPPPPPGPLTGYLENVSSEVILLMTDSGVTLFTLKPKERVLLSEHAELVDLPHIDQCIASGLLRLLGDGG